jgi:hypothetical protein
MNSLVKHSVLFCAAVCIAGGNVDSANYRLGVRFSPEDFKVAGWEARQAFELLWPFNIAYAETTKAEKDGFLLLVFRDLEGRFVLAEYTTKHFDWENFRRGGVERRKSVARHFVYINKSLVDLLYSHWADILLNVRYGWDPIRTGPGYGYVIAAWSGDTGAMVASTEQIVAGSREAEVVHIAKELRTLLRFTGEGPVAAEKVENLLRARRIKGPFK